MLSRSVSGAAAVVACGAAFLAAILGGCGAPPAPVEPKPSPSASAIASGAPTASATSAPAPRDVCEGSPPRKVDYFGVLQDSKCDNDKFPIMAEVALMLGVECRYCHVPDPNNAREELFPVMTPRKEKANWMRMHLMKAIKPADGSKLECRSCHTDAKGNPVAKILGEPRDELHAQEWMSLVMTTKFVVASTGEKLKCKHCHVGNLKTPQWSSQVILTDHIPAH